MLTGAVDVVLGGRVAGWAYDSSNPDRHLTIIVSDRNGEIARGVANILRQDLAGTAGNGDHSFRLQIPDNLTIIDIEVVAEFGGEREILQRLREDRKAFDLPKQTLEDRITAIETRMEAAEVFFMRLDEMLRKIIEADKKKRKRWLGIF